MQQKGELCHPSCVEPSSSNVYAQLRKHPRFTPVVVARLDPLCAFRPLPALHSFAWLAHHHRSDPTGLSHTVPNRSSMESCSSSQVEQAGRQYLSLPRNIDKADLQMASTTNRRILALFESVQMLCIGFEIMRLYRTSLQRIRFR